MDAALDSIATRNAIEFVYAGRGTATREIGMRSTDSRADELLSQPGVEMVGLR